MMADGADTEAVNPDRHYALVVQAIANGRVVPFLGAGASLCGRPADTEYEPDSPAFLPRADELARHLASKFSYDGPDENDLARVAQYVDVVAGRDWLYETLHKLFIGQYEPNELHRFLAELPQRLFRDKNQKPRYQLIVTTNYDDALERAFDRAGEPYHLVWYLADGADRGAFMHRPPDGEPRLARPASEYIAVSSSDCSVILKIHGAVARNAEDHQTDSYVIAEDHYIDYLTDGTKIEAVVPVKLANQLKRAQFLFLGYGLRDWNLRVILNRISRERTLSNPSWAVQKDSRTYDVQFWQRHSVTIRTEPLETYVQKLHRQVAAYQGRP